MALPPPGIPLGDVEIAQRIAEAARRGRPVDRAPTLEQLLAAFGEMQATPAARARAAAALSVAGVTVTPDLMAARPGTRVGLQVAGARRPVGRVAAGVLALVAIVGAASAAAVLLRKDSGKRVSDLPETTTTLATTTTTTVPATTTATTATTPTTAPTTTATTTATATTTTTPASTTTAATTTAKARTTPARPTKKKATKRRRATVVSVVLVARQPTYACIKDGTGRQLFGGTLSGRRRFKAKVIRLNIGLGDTTTLLVNGRRLPLLGSPAGYELRTGGRHTVLGTGQRPEC